MESTYTPASAAKSAEDTDALFTTLYSELHRLAKRQLARKSTPVSLSVTTLLHETYLDMAAGEGTSFPDSARFMGYAARVMRGLIIDHAPTGGMDRADVWVMSVDDSTSVPTALYFTGQHFNEDGALNEAAEELLETALGEAVALSSVVAAAS